MSQQKKQHSDDIFCRKLDIVKTVSSKVHVPRIVVSVS